MSNFVAKYWSEIVLGYVVFSCAVDAMEEPTATDSRGYRWLYRFGHGLSGNLFTAFGKLPQINKEKQ